MYNFTDSVLYYHILHGFAQTYIFADSLYFDESFRYINVNV